MLDTRNRSRVPKKQWRKWSVSARAVFNELYRVMLGNPDLFQATGAPTPKPFNWKVTSWNAAWIAADAVDDAIPAEVRSGKERKRAA